MSYELKTNSVETLGLVSLEPRILLDAAGFVTGAEVAMETMVSEGAELGVQAIFEGDDAVAATPMDGPWLGEVSATPMDGPWLGEVAATPMDGPWLGEVSATPMDGPWLGEVAATPMDGPWLGQITLTEGGDATAATPMDGPWL